MHDNEQYFFEALKAGASGYVLKSAVDRGLVDACRAATRGEPFIYPAAGAALVQDHLRRAARGEQIPRDPLTRREQEIVKLIAEAYTNDDIAQALVVSRKTVERHRANVLEKLGMQDREKLGMQDRVELTRYVIRCGLTRP